MFRERGDYEKYRQISMKELEEIKIKMDKPSSDWCSWGCEVIAIDKIDVENNVMYLQVKEFVC